MQDFHLRFVKSNKQLIVCCYVPHFHCWVMFPQAGHIQVEMDRLLTFYPLIQGSVHVTTQADPAEDHVMWILFLLCGYFLLAALTFTNIPSRKCHTGGFFTMLIPASGCRSQSITSIAATHC